jgi:hypothetical protein
LWHLLFRSCSVVVTGPIGLVRGLATNQKEPKLIDVLAAVAIAMAHPQSPVDDTSTMAVCSYEDGNTDGLPCVDGPGHSSGRVCDAVGLGDRTYLQVP